MLRHWVACGQDGDCLEVILDCGVGDLLLPWMLVVGGGWAWFCWQRRHARFGGDSSDTRSFPHVNEVQLIFGVTLSAKANSSSA